VIRNATLLEGMYIVQVIVGDQIFVRQLVIQQ